MTQCPENISFYIWIAVLETIDHLFDFSAFGRYRCRTCIDEDRKPGLSGEFSNGCLIHKCQGADHGESSLKKALGWHHGADFSCVTDIQKKGFDKIIPVMTESQLPAAQFIRYFKQAFASEMRT